MAELKAMYPGISFSPMTVLTASINAADTVIPVESTAHLPDGPNIATIGADENAEVIIYAAKTANSLSGCTRGVEGTAKAWQVGEVIARNWTRTDYQTLMDNIKKLNDEKQEAGDPLATFYPTVTEAGDLFWTNDQGLKNPKTVNIKGPAGTPGTRGVSILHTKDMVEYQYTEDSHGNSSYYFRMLIQTIKTQAGVNEVLVGDTILSDLSVGQLYVVTEINGEYAILREGSSVKGEPGDAGAEGPQGPKGDTGETGPAGANGTSVTVKTVSESTADGGSNVVTFSDGKTLTVKNGSKGSKGDKGDTGAKGDKGDKGDTGDAGPAGANGKDGKTPVKGTDYFTPADKNELVAAVIAALPDASEVSY